MTLVERLSASVARHWARLGAEATEFHDPAGFSVRVEALWGEDVEVEVGRGFRATANTVLVPASALVDPGGEPVAPRVGARVVRRPDAADGSWEEWKVAPEDADGRPLALGADGYWRVPVERNVRPTGRTP